MFMLYIDLLLNWLFNPGYAGASTESKFKNGSRINKIY